MKRLDFDVKVRLYLSRQGQYELSHLLHPSHTTTHYASTSFTHDWTPSATTSATNLQDIRTFNAHVHPEGYIEISLMEFAILASKAIKDISSAFSHIVIADEDLHDCDGRGKHTGVMFDLLPQDAYNLIGKLQQLRDEFDEDVEDEIEIIEDAIELYELSKQQC